MDLYDAIYTRRDVREFVSDPIPDETLWKILNAAHHAGSVGFMQPWNFIVIRSLATRRRIQDLFGRENEQAAAQYEGERARLYRSLKLEGILEAPLNLAITVDHARKGPHVLGRHTMRQMDVYSACCAVQNLWLAARAEGIGVGWVSILDYEEVKRCLGIPEEQTLVAYLCLGYPKSFPSRPVLETTGWETRLPLAEVVFQESWGAR